VLLRPPRLVVMMATIRVYRGEPHALLRKNDAHNWMNFRHCRRFAALLTTGLIANVPIVIKKLSGHLGEAASAAEQKSAADIAREKTPNRENKLAIDGLRSLSFKHLSGLMWRTCTCARAGRDRRPICWCQIVWPARGLSERHARPE